MKQNFIAKSRAGLIIDHPFFASLLLPMPISESDEIPTFATDGDSIIYNPQWASKLTQGETTFVLAHEVLHCVFDHMNRRGNRDHNRFNQACDYVINQILVDEKIGTMPKEGLLDAKLVQQGKGTAEGVYNLLPKSSSKNSAGQKGGALDSVFDHGSNMGAKQVDAATKTQKQAEMKVRIIQAKNAAKMQGKMSGNLARLIDDLVRPKIDWKNELRRFFTDRAKTDFSFARPKRRFLADDFYLPSLTGDKLGEIVIAIDCSGSISQKLLTQYASEINAIRNDLLPSKIIVIYFDSAVLKVESFEQDAEIVLKMQGGGGTAFSPVFQTVNKMPESPLAVIFLTDLCCSDFGPIPDYPVLWAVLESSQIEKVPFGEIIKIHESESK